MSMSLGRGRYELVAMGNIADADGRPIFELDDAPLIRGVYSSPKGDLACVVPIRNESLKRVMQRCRQAALEHLLEEENA